MLKHSRDVAFISGIVYFSQGALGISGVALPLFMRSLSWSVSEITTISSLAAAPWVFKILYGLLSDTYPLFGYRRKSYLIVFSVLAALGWIALFWAPPSKQYILFCLFLTNTGFAATDVITDGLIVEHSTEFTSPIYQAIAWGSRSCGAMASGILGGWLAAHWEPKKVFLITSLLPIGIMGAVLWIKEKRMEKAPFNSAVAPVIRCTTLLLTSNIRWFIAILFIAAISASFGIPFFFHMKETLGFKETFLGFLSSLGWSGAAIGSFIYARWLRKISPKVLLRWAIILNSINIFSTLLISDQRSAFVLVFFGGILGCLVMLPIMSSAASLTHHTGVEGTLFAVLMSIFNLGQILFGYLGGSLYEKIGLYPLITATGLIALIGLFFVEQLTFGDIPPESPISHES